MPEIPTPHILLSVRESLDSIAAYYQVDLHKKVFTSELDLLRYLIAVILPAQDLETQLDFLKAMKEVIELYEPIQVLENEKKIAAIAYMQGSIDTLEKVTGIFKKRPLYKQKRNR